MRGMIGKPGAGSARSAGIPTFSDRPWASGGRPRSPSPSALEALRHRRPTPARVRHRQRDPGHAGRDRRVFMAMGATSPPQPRHPVTEAALRNCALTVQVSTKLNRSHVVPGRTALILPALGRTDRDVERAQTGRLGRGFDVDGAPVPGRPGTAGTAGAQRGGDHLWAGPSAARAGASGARERFATDYDTIRDEIAAVVPGCADYNRRMRQPDGFQLPHPPRDTGNSRPAPARPTSPSTRCSGCRYRRGGWCCRPCAATISTTPRFTAWTTVTAGSAAGGGWSSSTRPISLRSA